jgi:hypothetical protein
MDRNRMGRIARIGITLFGIAAAVEAQSISVLVQDGDAVAGVGNVTSVANAVVNDCGDWLVEADTDNPNLDFDGVVVRSSAPYLQEGQPLASPLGAAIDSFDDLSLNDAGATSFNFFLDNLTSTTDSGVYFDTTLVLPEDWTSIAPQFSPSTKYRGFFGTQINDTNRILVVASVDDPAIPSTVDRALVIARVDLAGNLISETVLAKEGDVLPELAPDAITDFGTNPHEFEFNDLADVLYTADLSGATTANVALMLNTKKLARRGDVSPFGGRTWDSVGLALDLNNHAETVFRGNLSGATTDDDVIVKNGTQAIVQEGDPITTGSGTWTFTSFGTGEVRISDQGDVFWFGDWNDPLTTQDTGLFVNGDLLVQEGVTTVGGFFVQSLSGVQDNFAISDDGRYVVFRGTLAGGADAAFLIDRGERVFTICASDGSNPNQTACPCGNVGGAGRGCANSGAGSVGASLTATGSPGADSIVLTATDMLPTSFNIFLQGSGLATHGNVFGDGIRCAGGQLLRLAVKSAVNGTSQFPAAGDPSIQTRSAALGSPIPGCSTRYYQVYYRDANLAFCPAPPGNSWNVTNGIQVTWP